jgi:drug/metabolite transporter (DMT)-like permease
VFAVVCALGSSLMYALASVLQHRGAISQPEERSLRMGLLVGLIQSPTWLTGLIFDGGGYVLQFIALGHGPIVVVQPLLVCGLLFALPIGAKWAGRRLSRVDWVGAVLVCAGLGVFLAVANPAAGRDDTSAMHWVVLFIILTALTVALTLTSMGPDARRRAVCLAAGAGVIYGGAAALTKTSAHLLARGVGPALTHWQPYVLAVVAIVGMLLGQSAFQAGTLDFSLPTMTVADPIVSIAIGASVFQESISSSAGAVAAEVVSLLVMTAGIYMLARFEAGAPGSKAAAAAQRQRDSDAIG